MFDVAESNINSYLMISLKTHSIFNKVNELFSNIEIFSY